MKSEAMMPLILLGDKQQKLKDPLMLPLVSLVIFAAKRFFLIKKMRVSHNSESTWNFSRESILQCRLLIQNRKDVAEPASLI